MKDLIKTSKDEISVTLNTKRKILCYAKIMSRTECYGILLSPININDGIIYNAILAQNQKVGGSSAGINDNAASATKAEIENMGYKSIGFWHSHAEFGAWHSSTDDGNLENLLLDFAGNTETAIEIEKKARGYNLYHNTSNLFFSLPLGNRSLEIKIKNRDCNFAVRKLSKDTRNGIKYDSDKRILYVVNNGELLALMNIDNPNFRLVPLRKEKIGETGTAYSIVVNHRGELYGEMAKTECCYSCGKIETKIIKNVSIKPVEVKKDIIFTEEELKEEIRRKVR